MSLFGLLLRCLVTNDHLVRRLQVRVQNSCTLCVLTIYVIKNIARRIRWDSIVTYISCLFHGPAKTRVIARSSCTETYAQNLWYSTHTKLWQRKKCLYQNMCMYKVLGTSTLYKSKELLAFLRSYINCGEWGATKDGMENKNCLLVQNLRKLLEFVISIRTRLRKLSFLY